MDDLITNLGLWAAIPVFLCVWLVVHLYAPRVSNISVFGVSYTKRGITKSDQRRRLTHILPRSYRLRWLGAAVVFFSVTTLLGFADLKAWSLGGIFLTSIAVALAGVHVGSKVEPD